MKLYSVSDGPPSLAVRMALKHLGINFELFDVDFVAGYHMTNDYAKMNPQKEIPVLDDDGFYLSESNAILQYLADRYAKDDTVYPKDAKARAIVNHRLAFNLSTYYRNIGEHVVRIWKGRLVEKLKKNTDQTYEDLFKVWRELSPNVKAKLNSKSDTVWYEKEQTLSSKELEDILMLPIFFGYERTPLTTKKVKMALDVFNTYLERLNKKYSAGDNLTIADFQLVTSTLCLEAINFDISDYPKVSEWYSRFKREYPNLWEIAEKGMKEIEGFNKNPPDLSHLNHPIHSFSKAKNH